MDPLGALLVLPFLPLEAFRVCPGSEIGATSDALGDASCLAFSPGDSCLGSRDPAGASTRDEA